MQIIKVSILIIMMHMRWLAAQASIIPGQPINEKNAAALKYKTRSINNLKSVFTEIIKGKVVNDEGESLPGVSVYIKGTTNGTNTDANGNYSLNVSELKGTLVFSFVGYVTEEVPLDSKTTIDMMLLPNIESLSEIVVIGYGAQKRDDVTGSISSIQAKDIKGLPQAGIDQMLQGKAAGVIVTNNSGQPGGGVSVRIRGITSLTGSNEPLYVIDGIQFTGEGQASQAFSELGGGSGQTAQSVLSSINPNDILSIDILKDASATAIYGSRASNGVIIVTTKRGKVGDSKISYDTYYGLQKVPRYIDVMNLEDYARYTNEVATAQGIAIRPEFIEPSLLGKGTSWQREVFEQASVMNHQLAFSGGKDKSQYYVSGGYFKQNGIIIGSGFDRYSLRVNTDNQVKDWLKLGNSITLSRTNQKITLNDDESGIVSSALLQSPAIPVKYLDGNWGGPENKDFGFQTNPVAAALLRDVRLIQNRLLGNLYMDIVFLKDFTFRTEFGGDVNFSQSSAFNPTYKWGSNVNTQNKYIRSDNSSLFWILKNYVTFNKNFNEKHHITAMVGHESLKSQWESLRGVRADFPTNDVQALSAGTLETATNDNTKGAQSLESYYARLTYGFNSRYNATFTYRADGSSKFASDNRWGFFPSAALSWTASNEELLKDINFIRTLKIRAGYGAVGNQNIPNYTYGAALKNIPSAYGSGFFIDKTANPKVRWESATQANLGIDVSLMADKISLSVDLYNKISKDFLFQRSLPYYTGYGRNWDDLQAPFVNLGKMQNRGIDITLNTNNITTDHFTWKSSANLSHYKNKLLSLDEDDAFYLRNVQFFDDISISTVGQPVGQFYGYQVDGVFRDLEQVFTSPRQSEKIDRINGTYSGDLIFRNNDTTSVNGKQVINGNDRGVIGSPHPKFSFGLTNTFTCKNLDLSIFLHGSYGAEIFNYARRSTEGMNDISINQLKTINDRWTPENRDTNMPRAMFGDPNNNRRISDRFVEDGSFLRVQNITLGYTLPEGRLQKAKIQRLRLYVSLQNLKTFTKYSGYDPELGSFNQDALLMNVDNGHYPSPRTYTVGLNIEF